MLAVWSFPENIAFPVAGPNLETRRLPHRSSKIGHHANDHRDVNAMGFVALQLIKKLQFLYQFTNREAYPGPHKH
jgi:hypothetical protein